MISKELIENRINNFWGYGSLDAPVWFVGMDERFDPSESREMLEKQFLYAEENMVNGMVDASRLKKDKWSHLANMEPFRSNGILQTTWKYPIALYLYLQSTISLTVEERAEVIREYQTKILADANKKETATLELSPLPCPSTKPEDWLYKDYGVTGLSSRNEYERVYLPKRVQGLKELVKKYHPKLVIFYSISYLPHWVEIIGKEPERITRRTLFAKTENSSFCIIPNGGQSGLSYNELYEFVDKIREQIVF